MKYGRFLLVVCFLSFAATLFAQEITVQDFRNAESKMKSLYWEKLQARITPAVALSQSDFDVKYWELNIDVTDIAGETVTGIVTMTSESVIDGLTDIDYNYDSAMYADSVKMGGQDVAFSHDGDLLNITLDNTYNTGDQFTTVVYYHGHPPGGGFGSFTWETHNGYPIVSTLSEPEGAREWWPCKDMPHDKADSADVVITVEDDLVATSNGTLVSDVDNGDGTETFHWHISYPITTYLISLAISNYENFTDWYVNTEGDSMPVTNYVYPELYDDAVIDLGITPDVITFYASKFGEYPFFREKYGHSIFPWGGAMEHQCNTSYGSMLIRGDHYYDWILAHELSHQWFGDMITCDTWPNIWLNEGFASYCEALWAEHNGGFPSYISYMRLSNGVSDPSGPIYDPDDLFSSNTVYNKGAWVLHMLRGVMGDDAFFDGMYAYANDPDFMYGTATYQGFQADMEQVYGASLEWFFDEWMLGMNRPTYVYSWMKEDIGGGQSAIYLHINQTQSPPAPDVFTMPIQINLSGNGMDTTVTVWNDTREGDWAIVINGDPTQLDLDPDYWILEYNYEENYGFNIVTTELPDGDLDHDYYAVIVAKGGTEPYTFTVVDGSLPPGIDLNSDTGIISGRPTQIGDYSFTIRCTDSDELTDDQDYQITIYEHQGIDEGTPRLPSEFVLFDNYPNPFNGSTVIGFSIKKDSRVSLEVFDILGRKVDTIFQGSMKAGEHKLEWKADSVPSGLYFYRLTTDYGSIAKKMALLK